MSSSDTTTLNSIGTEIFTSMVCVAVETVFITVYSVLVIKATMILLTLRKAQTVGTVFAINMALVGTMYLTSLTLWIIDLVNLVALARITLVDNPELDLEVKFDLASQFVSRRLAVEDVLYAYLTVLGDTVIIWRVRAFWATGNWKIAMILPLSLLLTSLATSMMLTYCVARLGGDIVNGSFTHPAFCRNMQTVSYAIPAVTTAVTTVLIGIKAWTYAKSASSLRAYGVSSAQGSTKTSRVESVMILLIESGLAYFLFFLAQVILTVPSVSSAIASSPNLSFATLVFSYQTSSMVGMYPTVIICLVHTKRSIADSSTYSSTGSSGRKISVSLGHATASNPSRIMGSREHLGSLNTHGKEVDVELQDVNSLTSTSKLRGEQ